MNCPEHRRKMWYEEHLSVTKSGVLVYFCSECNCLWRFEKKTLRSMPGGISKATKIAILRKGVPPVS